MHWIVSILLILATFLLMEGVAWATHKYVMHGFLWYFHKDHHRKDHDSWFERNDFFFLIFAIPGMSLMFLGLDGGLSSIAFCMGLGITLYGLAYFLVHDIFIHQRFKILRKADHPYFKAIRRAHKIHHKHLGKQDGECFGMLFVPRKFLKDALRSSS